jgi:hypothetical protein
LPEGIVAVGGDFIYKQITLLAYDNGGLSGNDAVNPIMVVATKNGCFFLKIMSHA